MKNESLQKELAQLRRENAQPKRMPLFVAAVVEVMENGEIYLRQQGNNQEYITQVNEELHTTLKPGTKVAVNNALSIVKIIGNIYDARVRVMELDESPDVTFEKIGGLKKEIEEVREAVEYPLTKPEVFRRLGVEPPKGILLHGPPGDGKDPDRESGGTPGEGNLYPDVGERACPQVHRRGSAARARTLHPCAGARAVHHLHRRDRRHREPPDPRRHERERRGPADPDALLAEMDGFDNRGDVRIMAATNRVDMLDLAILRRGGLTGSWRSRCPMRGRGRRS